MPLNQTDGGGRVLGQDQHHVFRTKHVQSLLSPRCAHPAPEGILEEPCCRRHHGEGAPGVRGPDAVGDQNTTVPSEKPAHI